MKSKILTEMLVEQAGGVLDNDVLTLGREHTTTLFASFGNTTLTIDRIAVVECRPEVLIITTHRSERYMLAPEDVRGLRVCPSGKKAGISIS